MPQLKRPGGNSIGTLTVLRGGPNETAAQVGMRLTRQSDIWASAINAALGRFTSDKQTTAPGSEPVAFQAAPSALSASGESPARKLGDRSALRLKLAVSNVTGTNPTLDVTVRTRRDSNDAWRTVGTFAQKTGVATERKCFGPIDREVSLAWTIGGTGGPSFTVKTTGEAI